MIQRYFPKMLFTWTWYFLLLYKLSFMVLWYCVVCVMCWLHAWFSCFWMFRLFLRGTCKKHSIFGMNGIFLRLFSIFFYRICKHLTFSSLPPSEIKYTFCAWFIFLLIFLFSFLHYVWFTYNFFYQHNLCGIVEIRMMFHQTCLEYV